MIITGTDAPLVGHLAAIKLAESEGEVIVLVDARTGQTGGLAERMVREALGRLLPSLGNDADSLVGRLRFYNLAAQSELPVAEGHPTLGDAWIVDIAEEYESTRLHDTLAAMSLMAVRRLSHVTTNCRLIVGNQQNAERRSPELYRGPQHRNRAAEQVVEHCRSTGSNCSLFRTSLIASHGLADPPQYGVRKFLTPLHSIVSYVRARDPLYFERHALQCMGPQEARVNVLPIHQAAARLTNERHTTADGVERLVASSEDVTWKELCSRAGAVFGVRLVPVDDPNLLNPIDALFDGWLDGFRSFLLTQQVSAGRHQYSELTDSVINTPLEREDLDWVEDVCASHSAAMEAEEQAVDAFACALRPQEVLRGHARTSYIVAGSGSPVVVVNALGQGLQYWYRLMMKLVRRHKVIVWSPRGLAAHEAPLRLDDHVDDLDAILRKEGNDRYHILAWVYRR